MKHQVLLTAALHGVFVILSSASMLTHDVRPLRSTLAFFHVPFDTLADAAKVALTALRARKLISLKPDGPEGPSHWELTPLGSAVVASALDPQTGARLGRALRRPTHLLHIRISGLREGRA